VFILVQQIEVDQPISSNGLGVALHNHAGLDYSENVLKDTIGVAHEGKQCIVDVNNKLLVFRGVDKVFFSNL
jgi:hypothetical protein